VHYTPATYYSLLIHSVTVQVHPASQAPAAQFPLALALSATHQHLSADFRKLQQFTQMQKGQHCLKQNVSR